MKYIPKIKSGQSLTDYADQLAGQFLDNSDPKKRKEEGQYFTPPELGLFMVRELFDGNSKSIIRILDPAAGIGIFLCSVCEIIRVNAIIKEIYFDLYEKDYELLPYLRKIASSCKETLKKLGITIKYKIFHKDFIQDFIAKSNLKSSLKFYDFVIANPPYYKLKKDSFSTTNKLISFTGTPNIYVLFMAIAAYLLEHGGRFVFLTPRSYCSGFHFKKFRNWFFNSISLEMIHSFISREEIFKREGVLQELLITIGSRSAAKEQYVKISTSFGLPDIAVIPRKVEINKVIINHNNDYIINVPESKNDEEILSIFQSFNNRFYSNGYLISTGPVVPFRTNDLSYKINESNLSFPLLWMENLKNGRILWPLNNNKKPDAILYTQNSKKILIENSNYVFIKRFSSKEEKRRIIASLHIKEDLPYKYLGIENHVNFIYMKGRPLAVNEARGITYFLNSMLYNRYFHLSNGNTQINASEIHNSLFPINKKIQLIGQEVSDQLSDYEKEVKILAILGLQSHIIEQYFFDSGNQNEEVG